jgi:flagellin
MSLTLNTNNFSINAQRSVATTQNSLALSMSRLSSGLRVNSAKDDAAGLAVASGMLTQAKGMDVAIRNANDGISMLQVADGALASMSDVLQRMRELAVQSLNGTYSDNDRLKMDAEYQELAAELTRVQDSALFNGTSILQGAALDVDLQVGANDGEVITITTTGLDTTDIDASDVQTGNATAALTAIDDALDALNTERAVYGASMSRLDNVVTNLRNGYEAQMSAYGRIMDADFARETANLSRAQVLQQAGVAMVAQANALPNQVLALLR